MLELAAERTTASCRRPSYGECPGIDSFQCVGGGFVQLEVCGLLARGRCAGRACTPPNTSSHNLHCTDDALIVTICVAPSHTWLPKTTVRFIPHLMRAPNVS